MFLIKSPLRCDNSQGHDPRRYPLSNNKTSELGRRFGKLVVVAEAEPWTRYNKSEQRVKNERRVLVRCDCGNEKVVHIRNLRAGQTKGCGCGQVEVMKKRVGEDNPVFKHGRSGTPIYSVWSGMIGRCENSKSANWSLYGGRGITVCARWRESFANFLEDMGERPEGKTLDRIDNDGNYEPDNCRWATAAEQRFNQGARKPKLNPDAVRSIRDAIAGGASHQSQADKWGVCRQTITDLNMGRSWRHVK